MQARCRLLLLFSVIPVFRIHALGQQVSPPFYKPAASRDPHAVEIVHRTIAALGGEEAITKFTSVIADGTAATFNQKTTVHWEAQNQSFRLETGATIFASDGVHGWHSKNGVAAQLQRHTWTSTIVPMRLGTYLLQADKDPLFTIAEAPEQSDDKTFAIVVRDDRTAFSHALMSWNWYIDRQSFLPTRIVYRERSLNSTAFFTSTSLHFDAFTVIEGTEIPSEITYTRPGMEPTSITFTSVHTAASLDNSHFSQPTGER